jgi:hypothetical protein
LENQGGGHLIHDFAVLLARVAGLVEDAVGLVGGEALVPEADRKAGEFRQIVSEGLRFGSAGALGAGEVERMADHDSGYAEPPRQARQGAQVIARIAFPLQGEDRLGGEAQFVGNGDADAPGADVEAEVARWLGGLQDDLLPTSLKPGSPGRA